MSFVELNQYHGELVVQLRDIAYWLRDGDRDAKAAAVKLQKVTDEIESAFHAVQAQLTDARTGTTLAGQPVV